MDSINIEKVPGMAMDSINIEKVPGIAPDRIKWLAEPDYNDQINLYL